MISKEETEKVKRGLKKELNRTIIANECGLSTNDFSESIKILEDALRYIEQLETREQKIIEKLEDKLNSIKKQKLPYFKTITDLIRYKGYAEGRIESYEEIVLILKGEKSD